MANPEIQTRVHELEILSQKTRLNNHDRERFILIVTELDAHEGWEEEYPNLSSYVSRTLHKFENQEVVRRRVIQKLRRESRFLGIFQNEERETIIVEERVQPGKEKGQRAPKSQINTEKKTSVPLPKELLDNQGLREQLQKLGILQGNNVVFENPDWVKDFKHYVELLGFLKKIPYKNSKSFANAADRKKVVANYLELSNESKTYWLLDKKYLELQYATAIYNDIIGNGCFLEKDRDGVLQIKGITPNGRGGFDTIANPLPEYKSILSGPNQNKLMDVAVVVAMIENNFTFDKEVVGQKSLIKKILEQNNIKGRNGEIQNPEALKLDWDFVKPQIERRRNAAATKKDGQNYQVFQEMTYVLNFMENEEYKRKDYSEEILTLANVYRLQYRGEKGAIDTMQRNGFDPEKPETWGDTMKKIAAENAPLAIIAGLFLTFFGGDSFGNVGKGLLAGLVGAFIGGDILNAVSGKRGTAKKYFTGEQLELLEFSQVKVETRFNNPNYTSIYNKLVGENERRRKNYNSVQGGNVSRSPYIENDFYIAKILHELLQADIDGGSIDTSDTNSAKVLALIPQNKRKIDGSEFGNIEENLKGKEITQNHIKVFLSLLGNTKESGDITLRDSFEVGRDPLAEIKAKPYTGDMYFDPAINTLFSDGYTGLSRANKKKRQELQALFVSELSGANKAKVDIFITKMRSDGYAPKFIDIVSHYSWHIETMEKINALRVPASFGQNEAALEQGILTLTDLETQRNTLASDSALQAKLRANPELFKTISEKIENLKKDIEAKKVAAQADLTRIQSGELIKDSAAKFGGDKGGRVDTSLVGKDANHFRSIFEGTNVIEIQKLRENIRELVKYLNQKYTDIENAGDIGTMSTIASDATTVEAFKILSNLKSGISSSGVANLASRNYLKEIVNSEYQKYTDGIHSLFNTKKSALETGAQSIGARVAAIRITEANIEQSGTEISSIRGEINAIKSVNFTTVNTTLRAIGVSDIGVLTTNIGQLETDLQAKEQEIERTIDTVIQNIRTAVNQELQDVLKLATLYGINNLGASSKTKLSQAQKELLTRLEGNTQISGISAKVGELKTLRGNPKILAPIQTEIDSLIGKLRTKFMTQKIDVFPEFVLSGNIISAFSTSLLAQAGQVPAGQTNPAQDALGKITGTPSPTLKELNDIVQRFSLSSGEYTNFMRSKNLID